MSSSSYGLRCRNLTVTLGRRQVLDRLSLEVARGEVCAVVGESGAGKTTLLRALAGFVPLESGELTLEGKDVSKHGPADRGVTLLFQEPRLFPALTVVENVGFALRVRGVPGSEWRQTAAALLEEVGLADRADDPVTGLSGGEQQRVALARALCLAPAILLLDEPFSAIDVPRRRELRDMVASLVARHQTTTVFVSHDINDAIRMADTVAVLIDGRIVQHDRVEAVRAAPVSSDVRRLVTGDALE